MSRKAVSNLKRNGRIISKSKEIPWAKLNTALNVISEIDNSSTVDKNYSCCSYIHKVENTCMQNHLASSEFQHMRFCLLTRDWRNLSIFVGSYNTSKRLVNHYTIFLRHAIICLVHNDPDITENFLQSVLLYNKGSNKINSYTSLAHNSYKMIQ